MQILQFVIHFWRCQFFEGGKIFFPKGSWTMEGIYESQLISVVVCIMLCKSMQSSRIKRAISLCWNDLRLEHFKRCLVPYHVLNSDQKSIKWLWTFKASFYIFNKKPFWPSYDCIIICCFFFAFIYVWMFCKFIFN